MKSTISKVLSGILYLLVLVCSLFWQVGYFYLSSLLGAIAVFLVCMPIVEYVTEKCKDAVWSKKIREVERIKAMEDATTNSSPAKEAPALSGDITTNGVKDDKMVTAGVAVPEILSKWEAEKNRLLMEFDEALSKGDEEKANKLKEKMVALAATKPSAEEISEYEKKKRIEELRASAEGIFS